MIDELIKKYFDKNCSDEEKSRIYEHLMQNPSAYAEYFSEGEWNTFLQNDQDLTKIEGKQTQAFYDKNRRSVVYKMLRYAAVAVVIIFSSFLLFNNHEHPKEQIAHHIISSPDLVVKINAGTVTEKVILPDSSVVALFPGSKLSYLPNFESAKRDISLEGSAIFKVYKNAQKPFTVFCNEVATTALGTKFKVSNSKSGKVLVELMEGKILVRRSFKKENDKNEQYYLLAGNAISFDRVMNKFTEIYSVIADDDYRAPSTSVDKGETEHLPKNAESLSEHRIETEASIQFNDETLPKVLDYLATAYKVKILYPTKYISRIHFVGRVHKNEDIHEILQNIAIMNDLELKRDSANNVFIIQIPSK